MPRRLQQEEAVIEHRLPLVPLFASLNRLDRVSHTAPERRLTVVTAGKAWLDLCQALADLGIDEVRCRGIGLRVVKLGLVWPMDAAFIREACLGSGEVLVVEEKRAFIEEQLRADFLRHGQCPGAHRQTSAGRNAAALRNRRARSRHGAAGAGGADGGAGHSAE